MDIDLYIPLDQAQAALEEMDPRFYNRLDQRWERQAIDYTASKTARLYGVEVAVMPRDELLRYKAMLGREVDHIDIQQITVSGSRSL